MRTIYLLSFFVLFSLTIGCDGDGPLKPGEFEDPAFAKCVKDRIDYAISIGLWQKDDPDIYNKVEMLECYGGGVKSLKGIENMPNMDDLSIVDNEIESLEPLRTLTKLEFLKLDNNKIKDLEPLSGLTELSTLLLSNNFIEDLTPLYSLSKLGLVSLDGNCIVDYSQFDELEKHSPNINLGSPEKYQTPEKCQ